MGNLKAGIPSLCSKLRLLRNWKANLHSWKWLSIQRYKSWRSSKGFWWDVYAYSCLYDQRDMELVAMAKKYEATIQSLDTGSSSSHDTHSFSAPSARIAGDGSKYILLSHHFWFMSDCLIVVQDNSPSVVLDQPTPSTSQLSDQASPSAPQMSSVPLSGATMGMVAEEVCWHLRANPTQAVDSFPNGIWNPRRQLKKGVLELCLEKDNCTKHNKSAR